MGMQRLTAPMLLLCLVLAGCGSGPRDSNVERPAAASSTTVASSTTIFAPPITVDPASTRPLWGEFSLLLIMDDEVADICRTHRSDADCYDAIERGTPDFEDVIRSRFSAGLDSGGGYQSNQYGCHDDGRCLDSNDVWCDDSEYDWEYDVCYSDDYSDDYYEPDYYDW
jgi:hypothetical protein